MSAGRASAAWWLAAAVALTVLAAAPLWLTTYARSFLLLIFMYVALAQSWNMISGYTGYISLGHGLFFGVGAYTFAHVLAAGASVPLALVAAGVAAVIVALPLGLVFMRVKMRIAYFAMATLGLNEIVRTLVLNTGGLGSSHGMTLPPVGNPVWVYYALLLLAVTTTLVMRGIDRSAVGLALKAVLQDEDVAEVTGVPTFRFKLGIFLASAFFPGVTGAAIAAHWSYIDPYMAFDLVISFDMSVMTVFGGIGTVWGPVLGAAIMGVLAELLSVHVPHLHALVFGGLVIVMVVASPGGMLEIAHRGSRAARAWRTGALRRAA